RPRFRSSRPSPRRPGPPADVPKPRELRRRIRSVQSTRKITKTMELVATSKLKRAQDRVIAARPYAAALAAVMADLYAPELAGRVDAVEVVFAQFRSAVSTPPTVLRILPVTPPPTDPATDPGRKPGVPGVPGYPGLAPGVSPPGVSPRSVNYILKPSAEAILESLLPNYVRNQVYRALVETAGEGTRG